MKEYNFVCIEKKKLKKLERAEILLYNVCAYLAEILHTDDMTAEHSKMAFGMTKEEHKKYILGV